MRFALIASLIFACAAAAVADKNLPADRLKIAVVQMSLARGVTENRDRILAGISRAAAPGVRVVVFPEGALRGEGNDKPAIVEEAVEAIRQAAKERNVYVLFGGTSFSPKQKRDLYWMYAIGPDGRDLFYYDKLYDKHDAAMPGIFRIDGVPCSAMICADRWLRGVEELPIQEGAQISFELSCNFASEWVAPYQWYWYVPRAMRNNVWVIFANTGNKVSGVSDNSSQPRELRHGHSAFVAPDGQILAASRDDVETIVVADVDVAQATRAEAQARANHPVLRPFWDAGLKLKNRQAVAAGPAVPLISPDTDITLAVAQARDDLLQIKSLIGEAGEKKADLVVFPERVADASWLKEICAAARKNQIAVVIGAEFHVEGAMRDSAFVIGPDGIVLTRYDQLSASDPYQAGADPASMWFQVKGVPAVVTIGKDALWTELSELAAVAGAQIHVHLDRSSDTSEDGSLRRLQVWSNMASFNTFTATANVVGSAIWDDLRGVDERRAEAKEVPRPSGGAIEVYSPFSANLVVRATDASGLIVATRRVNRTNPHHPRQTSTFNPQMDAWYRLGAQIIHPTQTSQP